MRDCELELSGVFDAMLNQRSQSDPGSTIPLGTHVNLQLQEPGRKSFFLEVDEPVKVGLYGQHTAEEFDLKVINADNEQEVSFDVDRTWVAQHEHDDEVGCLLLSVTVTLIRNYSMVGSVNSLREKGIDI